MRIELDAAALQGGFVRDVESISGQPLMECYQCGRCSAGCPVVDAMDLLPNQVIRLAQLGLQDVLTSTSPWICASCLTCQARCPKGIDVPRVMEAIRQIALRGAAPRLVATQVAPDLLAHAPQMAIVGALRKAGK